MLFFLYFLLANGLFILHIMRKQMAFSHKCAEYLIILAINWISVATSVHPCRRVDGELGRWLQTQKQMCRISVGLMPLTGLNIYS